MQSVDTAANMSGSPDRASSPVPGTCPSCKETITVSVDIGMASSTDARSLRTYCQEHWDQRAAVVMLRKEKLDVGVDAWMHHPLRAFCCACNRRLFVVEERRRACSRSQDPHRTRTWSNPSEAELPLPNIPPARPRASRASESSKNPPGHSALVPRVSSPQQALALAPIKQRSQSLSPTPQRHGGQAPAPADTEHSSRYKSTSPIGPKRLLPCIPIPVSPPPRRATCDLFGDEDTFVFNPLPESSDDSDSTSPESAAILFKKISRSRQPPSSPRSQSGAGTSRSGRQSASPRRPNRLSFMSSDSPGSQPRDMRPRSVTRWSPTPTERRARPSPPMPILAKSPSTPALPVGLVLRQAWESPSAPALRPALSENSVEEYRRRRRNRILDMACCARKFMYNIFHAKKK